MPSPRIIGAIICGLLAIGLDFYSQVLSITTDLFCVAGIFILLWPIIKGGKPYNNA